MLYSNWVSNLVTITKDWSQSSEPRACFKQNLPIGLKMLYDVLILSALPKNDWAGLRMMA